MRPGALELSELQQRLDYSFSDEKLLMQALTHKSAFDGTVADHRASYQRLEFLGDRVLALVIAEMIYAEFPDAEEGELARRLTSLVRNESCADVATDLKMGDAIFMSQGEQRAGGRQKAAILGDICEAVIAAIYLDGGMKPADAFIRRNWTKRMHQADKPLRDAKTTLQEWAHANRKPTPRYEEVSRSGPDHKLHFIVHVLVDGFDPVKGDGNSKRDAQQDAATRFLTERGVWQKETS